MAELPNRRCRLPECVESRFPAGLGVLFHASPGCCGSKPNPAHFALAKLEQELGGRLFLCTQNVDALHEQAGSKNVVHMHRELFKSRGDTCSRAPFRDTNTYDFPAELPRCECGSRIRPRICWFGEVPFELDRIFGALDECTPFMAVGTSGVVEPAASLVGHVGERELFTCERRNPRTHPSSPNAIWGRRVRCCPIC
jgi:NAD-dependent SIR2 family protein deacetylase